MSTLRVEMHLGGHSRVLQRDVIRERLVDAVHVIVLVLQEKRGWGGRGDLEVGVQGEITVGVGRN